MMSRVQSRVLPRVCLQVLAAALVVASLAQSVHAQTALENRDYDLVADNGLYHYAQTDGRWAPFVSGPYRNNSIGACGCLLSVLATVLNHQVTGTSPWFPVGYRGGGSAFDFNPHYLDLYFHYGLAGFGPGWGYKQGLAPETCGVVPLIMGLQSVGHFGGQPAGVNSWAVLGFGQNVKDIINRNLNAGRPTIAFITRGGDPTDDANHAVLIAGWDMDAEDGNGAYRFLDPADPRTGWAGIPNRPQVKIVEPYPAGTGPVTYQNYIGRIKGILDITAGGGPIRAGVVFGDDPSPIEIVMTGPNGRRTGFDPQTGASFEENGGASYWTFGPWSDPLGEARVSAAPRFISVPNAPIGTYHFKVTGTADGPLHLSSETIYGGTRMLHGEFGGTIAAGEVRKYELQFAGLRTSTVTEVTNFTPHSDAGEDLHARTDAPIRFDGRRSFDADGAIASYAWEFGDGGTAVGAQPQHVYSVPGDYTVTLTVTDANGATATDSMNANLILSQRRPVAHASGPYIGFASTDPSWYVLFDARGSSDPNGEQLTYRWDFGDGSPIQTTTAGFVGHLYAAMGQYTMTVVVNDGIEDSAPATASVEVVQAPGNYLTWWSAALAPNCGSPGQTITIQMGEFAQFQWWNFGVDGALPMFPPTSLQLGLSAPDGHISISLPGGEAADVPFHATLLSPGRYTARATFVVPNVGNGTYDVGWAEADTLPFRVPCPVPDNREPRAEAGGPYSGGVGSPIAFDGSASSDPEGDYLQFEWDFGDGEKGQGEDPEHSYAEEGRYIVTLTVSDDNISTTTFASATITAVSLDTTPPVTTAVSAPSAGSDGWNTTDVGIDLTAVDNPGGSGVRSIAFALSGAQTDSATVAGDAARVLVTREGATDLVYFATDNAGNLEAPQSRVIRIDRTGPTISGMPGAGCSLWPPNHQFVTVAQVSASDGGSGLAPDGLVLTATSSEPENALGDGNTGPDIVITGGSVALRAERSGTGVGRTYTITATATDRAGNTARAVSVCVVPHDQGPPR